MNDYDALKKEQDAYKDLQVIRKLDNSMVQRNYLQIKQDVQDVIQSEMERLVNDYEPFGGEKKLVRTSE